MKKDAYYFPHFCNARHDRKLKRVIKDLGIEGYGIYFMLLEVLREQPDFKYPIEDIDLLADEFGTSESKVSVVIHNYELFTFEGTRFFSIKQVQYLQPYLEKVQRAKEAATLRWAKANADANADANALPIGMQGKESKVKEKKEKKVEVVLEGRDLIWDRWFKYKKEKKQSYTETGRKALLNKYEDESDDVLEAMIEQSITNNWAGLFPLREPLKPKTFNNPFKKDEKPYAIVVPDDF